MSWTQKGRQYITKDTIEEIRKAVKEVEEGRFVPDRENDELSRALGNKRSEERRVGKECRL